MRLHPRSGLAWKQGISLANAEGVIDADYIQETFVCVLNMTDVSHVIKHGDRIAQLELVPVWDLRFEEVDVAPSQKTDRQGGFGSTGVHT
jgi:dUTP pyrophosphatase